MNELFEATDVNGKEAANQSSGVKLYVTSNGLLAAQNGEYYHVAEKSLDALVAHEDLHAYLLSQIEMAVTVGASEKPHLLPPIGNQEVWAAGVTYYRSRNARIEESKDAGGGDFYDRVYTAERPELFFKSVPSKVVGHCQQVRIRGDATWSVPEPELALLISPRGEIIGYTVGNDMSSRDIEALNPLYLPQAKVYDASCALGPAILVRKNAMPSSTQIQMRISRSGEEAFSASVTLSELKREPAHLVEYLFRDSHFPFGCFLLTGTGIVPPDEFALQSGDEIRISIDEIGTLKNIVA
jgi:2-dehydro-3-deoxy-D-arabinonate dehydratase